MANWPLPPLPLGEQSAWRWLRGVLEPPPQRAAPAESLLQLLADDPLLSLWAWCGLAARSGALPTPQTMAAWLADDALPLLADLTSDCPAQCDPPAGDSLACDAHMPDALGADAIVADAIVADAIVAESIVADAVAAEWLVRRDPPPLADDADDFEARYDGHLDQCGLVARVAAVARRLDVPLPLPSDPALLLAAARGAELADQLAARTPGAAPPGDLAAAWQRGEAARALWRQPMPRAEAMLCGAAARLAEGAALRRRFDAELHSARMQLAYNLAYGAGHEINNPLAAISGRAQALLADEPHPQRREALASIKTQAHRAHEMIADLMYFARPPAPLPRWFPLRPLLDELAARLRPLAVRRQAVVRVACSPPSLALLADRGQIDVALTCLISNALEAVDPEGWVEVAAAPAASPPDWIEITVRDNGPGVPAAIRSQVFDPFFSGREAGRGLGLGLSKSWRVARQHGGGLLLDDTPAGATFRLRLPRRAALGSPQESI